MKFIGKTLSYLLSALLLAAVTLMASPQASYAVMDGPAGSVLAELMMKYGVQRTFPANKIYINTGLAAPPNRVVEIFISPKGNDDFETRPTWFKGFDPGTAFATPQGCYNYIQQVFTMNGVLPICRAIANASAYTGKIEISGAPHGRQIQGGGQITFWGTCPLTNSPYNGVVGYSGGKTDVTFQSNVGQSLFSLVNGAYLQVSCLTASADVFIFYSQQQSNLIINSEVKTVIGPGGSTIDVLHADNAGQIYATGLTVAGGSSGSFTNAGKNSGVTFFGGASSITMSGTPSFGTTLTASDNAIINIGTASTFAGSATGSAKCSITHGARLISGGTGASVPGGGSCTVSSATYATEH